MKSCQPSCTGCVVRKKVALMPAALKIGSALLYCDSQESSKLSVTMPSENAVGDGGGAGGGAGGGGGGGAGGGAGGGVELPTVTVVDLDMEPPLPVQVSVYVAV